MGAPSSIDRSDTTRYRLLWESKRVKKYQKCLKNKINLKQFFEKEYMKFNFCLTQPKIPSISIQNIIARELSLPLRQTISKNKISKTIELHRFC